MPGPGKYRGAVVRQLSLQNQTPLQSPSSRGLKKQLSEDDSRVLESVGVTGQGWSAGRGEVRIGSGGGKCGQGKMTGARPKPVRVAWAEKKPECPAGVEVIATKCQGQPRPTSVRNQRLRSPLLGNKDTLVYTRLQLAERLRNAWSEREKIKPNINIFLARAPDSTRSDNEPATDRPPAAAAAAAAAFQDSASAFSDPSAPLDKKRKAMKVRAFSQEFSRGDSYSNDGYMMSDGSGSELAGEGKEAPQELNKIEIRMTKIQDKAEGDENQPPEAGSSVGVKRCRNKTCESSGEGKSEGKDVAGATAQDRRANFRRSSIFQKTITESFSSDPPERNEETEVKTLTKQPQKKPPLVRAFSAPSQNEPPDIHKAANLQKKVKITPQRRLQPSVSFDLPSKFNRLTGVQRQHEDVFPAGTNGEDASRDRVKSAPVKRRLKSARRKTKEKDSSDEEKDSKEATATTASKKTTRRAQLKKGADIVTMVSLVSPTESDTEDSLMNLPVGSWREEEKDQPPQDTKPTPGPQETRDSAFVMHKFVSLRKTTKSVTFQPHPVLARSYSASFPSRRAPAGTPIIVPTPVITNPALTPAQLLERDRRPPAFSSPVNSSDARGIKRRLLRSSTEFPKDDDDEKSTPEVKSCEGAKATAGLPGIASGRTDDGDDEDDDEGKEKTNGEPELKCPKERECWNLYQKMLEKGVTVSFDTVLRGMLTPTEYRLRKNQLLSNC